MSAGRPLRAGTRVTALTARHQDPEPVAVPGGQKPEGRATAASTTSLFSRSAVPKSRLAERSATTHVSISRSASVVRTWGVERSGGEVPVHSPGVVARLVRSGPCPLGSRSAADREIVTRQHPVEAPGDLQLEPSQDAALAATAAGGAARGRTRAVRLTPRREGARGPGGGPPGGKARGR